MPVGGKGGKPPVPTGAVPKETEWEAEADVDGVALTETDADGVALAETGSLTEALAVEEALSTGKLSEMEALLPVGTGLRQKSFSHQVYLPLSVALQRVEMQVSTRGPTKGAQSARESDTLNCWKQLTQQSGSV